MGLLRIEVFHKALAAGTSFHRHRAGHTIESMPTPTAQAAIAQTKTVHTVCSHDCPDSCGVLVTIDDAGRATRVQGDPNHPVTRGFLCGKVAKYLDRVYSPDRLLYPMRRRAGVAKCTLAQGRELEAF